MRIVPYGEKAILIEFEQQISISTNQQVQNWEQLIRRVNFTYLSHTIPAYASLVLVFERPIQNVQARIKEIQMLEHQLERVSLIPSQRRLHIPVCYETPYALDQQVLEKNKQLSWEEIVALHLRTRYQVYMLGFSPGFAFMGKIPFELEVKRKKSPRLKVPAGSVGIAGQQTGIYPSEIPGGWQILGQTPIPVFSPLREKPFLFQVGDQVQFHTIDQTQFLSIKAAIRTQTFNWEQLYE